MQTEVSASSSLDADAGVVFPLVAGARSTSATGRAVVADALRAVAPEAADRVLAVHDWRSGYLAPFRAMTRIALVDPAAVAPIAADGLAAVHARFRFRRGGQDLPLEAAAGGRPRRRPRSSSRAGGAAARTSCPSPYRGGRLVAEDLDRQLDRWLAAGTAEPSFADAVRVVMARPQWLDLAGVTVVVLGAGAQMGPLVSLLGWGAHVVAVDLPDPRIWSRLIEVARASPGRLSVPVARPLPASARDEEIAAAAGVDLVRRTPQVLAWLLGVQGPFTLGSYVYADGAAHVRASVAVDVLTRALLAARPDVSLAFLATPTDAFAVPGEVVEDSRRRYAARSGVSRATRIGTAGRLFRPNYPQPDRLPDGSLAGVNDSLVPQQGPNYALAKRIQRWRALQARADGRLVSLNVAPPPGRGRCCATASSRPPMPGAHRFGIEVFDPSTSNTLMAALLVHDLRHPPAVANPATVLAHPLELLWQGANHGGLWRNPFEPRSVLGMAVALGMLQRGA